MNSKHDHRFLKSLTGWKKRVASVLQGHKNGKWSWMSMSKKWHEKVTWNSTSSELDNVWWSLYGFLAYHSHSRGKYQGIFYGILSVPQNIVMDLNSVMSFWAPNLYLYMKSANPRDCIRERSSCYTELHRCQLTTSTMANKIARR